MYKQNKKLLEVRFQSHLEVQSSKKASEAFIPSHAKYNMKLYPFSLDYNPWVNFDFTDFLNVSFEVLLQVLVISMPCLLS